MTNTTSRTARRALPYLFPGQSQKEVFVNEAFARIDSALFPVVIDERAAPPPAPEDGDAYLVAANATDGWAGHDGAIASWTADVWFFDMPGAGHTVWESDRAAFAVHDGTAWRRARRPNEPIGGQVVDTEARQLLSDITDQLRLLGIFSAV